VPEGSEVKLSADLIRPLAAGKTIVSIQVGDRSRYQSTLPEGMQELSSHLPLQVEKVSTKGKFLYWTLGNDWHLWNTFGMTGQWAPEQGKHPCLSVSFSDATQLFFNDPRHFGTIKFVHGSDKLKAKLDELGWDPLSMPLEANLPWIRMKLGMKTQTIAEVLMDQTIFAGVGNYVRAEVVYSIQMSPFRPAKSLSTTEVERLCRAIVEVMQSSYAHQGATISTYQTPYGEEGRYSSQFQVYGRKIDPHGHLISKQDIAGRTMHFCPTCQT
jgi:formamidopyrimidine-DNA glycosylase